MIDPYQVLLRTKLHRPLITKGVIDRPQLFEILNNSINHPLTLVLASAGFGKTTLVSTWLEHMAAGQFAPNPIFPAAWLSLDENDGDLTVFFRYFIAALRTIFPNACNETLMLLQASQQPPPAVLYATFSNEIDQLPESFILVLDDFHTIHGTEINDLLNEWTQHWPEPLHLVLISRISPTIPLTKLRGKDMLTEIRARDLRFTTQETTAFLEQRQLFHLSQSALHLLEKRFEGWPAGLHLATLSLHSTENHEAVLAGLPGENANITEYLVDEVLEHQFPAIQTFLLKTSILNRFCASLCAAVVDEIDPAWNIEACLQWIDQSELFLIPLDNRREWYRYHHLFQKSLQERLSRAMTPDQVNQLHLRAAAWFEKQGLVEEALQHALAAGDLDLAARLMIAGMREVVNREDWPTLERWLRLLPEKMIQQNPQLLMIRVWLLELIWRLDLQAPLIQQVEALIHSEAGALLSEEDQQILRGQILMVESQYAYFSNQIAPAITLSRQALALLPPSWTFVRGAAMLYLGFALQANGDVRESERLLLAEYEACADKSEIYPLIVLQSLGFTYIFTGQLDKAGQISRLLIQQATLSGIIYMKNWGDYYLGVVNYHCNELEPAAKYFNEVFQNRVIANGAAYHDSVAGLVLIHHIKGESAEAWRMLEMVSQFDLEQRGAEDYQTSSLRARLMLLEGDLTGAGRWADTFSDLPVDQPLIWLEEPQVTRARILVARGTDADLRTALEILKVLDEIAERTHNTSYKIVILALRALALDAQGESSQANAVLKQAVDLSKSGGFVRIFVDLGQPMQALLSQLVDQNDFVETVLRILAAFPDSGIVFDSPDIAAQPARYPSMGISTLVEPLTPRELEVLTLLRGSWSIKEIALKLNISYATVRRHTMNLYAKLGVNQRWAAVAKAEELGLLPPR